jgi:hypothetical protein
MLNSLLRFNTWCLQLQPVNFISQLWCSSSKDYMERSVYRWKEKMPTPLCSLHTARPTPTTLSFTVSTRTPLQSIGWRIFYRFVLILRLIFVCQILLLLWIKWEFTFESASLKGIPLWLIDSAPGRIGTRLVTAIPGQYLVPLCLFCLWVLVKRGYTGLYLTWILCI